MTILNGWDIIHFRCHWAFCWTKKMARPYIAARACDAPRSMDFRAW